MLVARFERSYEQSVNELKIGHNVYIIMVIYNDLPPHPILFKPIYCKISSALSIR